MYVFEVLRLHFVDRAKRGVRATPKKKKEKKKDNTSLPTPPHPPKNLLISHIITIPTSICKPWPMLQRLYDMRALLFLQSISQGLLFRRI